MCEGTPAQRRAPGLPSMIMKKCLLLVAVLSMFAAACKSDSTIDMGSEGAGVAESSGSTGQGGEGDEPTPRVGVTDSTDAPAATALPATGVVEAVQAVIDSDDWCTAANAVENSVSALDTLNFTDPIDVEQGITQSLAVITAAKRLVPSEISADLDQSIEAFTILASAFEDVNWVFLDLDLSIIDRLDAPMELATYNIDSYNFAECGIGLDPGPAPVISNDGGGEGDADIAEFDGTIRERAVQSLVDGGLSAEEANCILQYLDFTDPTVMSDPSALLAVFADCGISLDRLAQLGG
ncbi:MAG: hypothetical protein ACI88C_003397 [Acidimicrobiales bacterium]|jgi:hypothetical protein